MKALALKTGRILGIMVFVWLAAIAGVMAEEPPPDIASVRVLDVETAQKIALGNNPSLAAAAERINQAKQRVGQARAAYWPSLDASASVSRVEISENARQENLATARIFNPQADVDSGEEYYRTGVSASWLLFDGFQRRFAEAAAQYGERQSRAAEADAKRLLLASVANAFYNAQLAREDIGIANADEDFNRRQMSDANARMEAGTGSLSDALNFEVLLNSATSVRIRAEREYAAAMIGLATLLGIPDAVFPEEMVLSALAEETENETRLPDTNASVAYALEHRPDLRQIEFASEQAKSGVGAARGKFYPTLSLSGSVNGERRGDAGLETDDFGNSIGVYMSYNIFSGGADRARLAETRHAVKEAEKNLESLENIAVSDVKKAATALESAKKQLALQRANESLVRKNRDLVEKEYTAGAASLVRLNDAQRNLIQAQSRLAAARVALRQAWTNLDASTGRILENISMK